MSKLSRIRILNLNYNNNTIKIDDETFDLGGENTLISLRNGGGKSVLVQMIVSLFVNRTYRDFGDRPFKSYFTTNRPTFLITEWQLDNGTDRFLAGMMVRKNQKEDNDTEELEMYTFTGSYSEGCKYDLDHLPIIRQDGNRKMLKGFGECRNLLDEISKNEPGDFRLYDMTSQYGRRQYFATLRQYQINNKEWESIIRKVNQKESGLSELFQNAKDEKNLVENWFLRPIEDKLNQEKSRIDEFRKLTFQFVEQYRSNQSKIQRKGIIEQYFEDTKPLKQGIDEYVEKDQNASELRTEMILYAKRLHGEVERLAEEITVGQEKLERIKKEQQQIVYEQLSYQIYQCEDQKTDILTQRAQQELEITRLTSLKNRLLRKTESYDLHRLYEELKDFETKKAEVDAKIQVLLQKTEESKDEIEDIGRRLYFLYSSEVKSLKGQKAKEETVLAETVNVRNLAEKEHTENEQQIRELNKSIGALENQVESYDEVEMTFNKEFEMMIQRNILGFYEEGFLDICQKEMEEEFQNQKNLSARYARKLEEQEQAIKKAAQEMTDGSIRLNDIAHDLHTASEHLADLEVQKKERCRIMKYVSVEECYLDRKDLILNHLDARIKELDLTRSSLIQKKTEQEKHFQQLKEGRTTELPENIKTYMEENGIDITYGMKWLTKNGRTAEENKELVRKNPFLPYAILMEKAFFEKFRKSEEELYTSFPIPIIIKEELEQELESADERLAAFGNIHFYVMFNTHLLNPEEMERILERVRQQIKNLEKFIEEKEADLETYRTYRNVIQKQNFSTILYQQKEKELQDLKEQRIALEQRMQEIRKERSQLETQKKQTELLTETARKQIALLERKAKQFTLLGSKYEQYVVDRTSLERIEKEKNEMLERQQALTLKLGELKNQEIGIQALLKEYTDKISCVEKKAVSYERYAESGRSVSELITESTTDLAVLEARYLALTKEISDSIEELTNARNEWQRRIDQKKAELVKKNEDSQISEAEYENLICSEEQYDNWNRQKKQAERELNKATEVNIALGEQEGALKTRIDLYLENLQKETGYEQPVERAVIVDTEFEKRLNFKKHDFKVQQKKVNDLEERNAKLSAQAAAVEEYVDEPLDEVSDMVKDRIPDISNEEIEMIRNYQKEIRKKMMELSKALGNCQMNLMEMIRKLASGKEYADEYFQKTFASLLSQTDHPQNLFRQFEMNRMAYENQLEKLKIDLAHIDEEQKNLEMMFLEYVEQVNANIGMIDKNSTINVRGRSLKMLRIRVADWESEKEHFRLKLHDYFDRIVKMGIETIEKNENLTEFLGKVITTRKLYDDIVGIQNVKIKLYKIEAEREVPISWSEVSANSGGEGFLSAFVILTCLLSYMRRDETDFFTTGEEGKVLIMDNPFAQTNAEHLLKPLMEMAKKTNTQLICLSGLGGDSIYNRFDNIYVLKLQDSSIRNGVQRVESTHVKGEPVKRMVLSEFKMEQVSLFEFMEE